MDTKPTLGMDDMMVWEAKTPSASRGKSVSQMFGEFVTALSAVKRSQGLPPVTKSLLGVMKGRRVSELDYKKHLR